MTVTAASDERLASHAERLAKLISTLPESRQDEYMTVIEQTLFGAQMAEMAQARAAQSGTQQDGG